jgi:trk system potassium uptake protein
VKILILGAGQVGSSLAQSLASEANDITVIDTDGDRLRELQDRIDIRTVQGRGSLPGVLARAGADDAEMLVAVTNTDETNMVACQVAHTLFRTPKKIARIRAEDYTRYSRLMDEFRIDMLISPEQLITNYILRLIEHPGALQVLDFADGRVQLVGVRAYYGGPLVGHELRTLRNHIAGIDTRVAAIYRRGRALHPEGTTVIEPDDEVFFIAAREHIRAVMGELRRAEQSVRRVMIAGGGNIGKRLAHALETRYQVKVIEANSDRAHAIADDLGRTIVLHGGAADVDLLVNENIDETDVFCALTNDDEANILSAMLAKRLGARKVMALINRTAYVDLVESSTIDIAISPPQATIGSLLALIRRGDVVNVHSLRRGAAEAIEAIAHGDRNTSRVVDRSVDEIGLPPGTTIGAVVRGDQVMIAHHDTVIKAEDHVILFLTDKRRLRDVERTFQVSFNFM